MGDTDAPVIRCPTCGTANRVPVAQVQRGAQVRCGKCKTMLPLSNAPVTVTDAAFAAEVERSPLPVLLDLWAPWCGPCLVMAPVLDQVAMELAGRLRVAKLNIDENPAIASRFGVQSIPTLLVLKDGKEVDRIIGSQPKSALTQRLARILS
jgi:thioredoxin 2